MGTFPDFDENRGALMMAPLGFRYTIYDNFVHGEGAGPGARSGEFFYNPISMPTLHWDNSTKELSAVAGETDDTTFLLDRIAIAELRPGLVPDVGYAGAFFHDTTVMVARNI